MIYGGFIFYLWGIETGRWYWSTTNISVVHILPMRNWNQVNQASIVYQLMRSYFTYEELKRLNIQFTVSIHACSYFTYEELKQVSDFFCECCKLCSYFTYEELKQSFYDNQLWTSDQFIFYLWGIETRNHENWFLFVQLVHILPMRNWNLN